MARRRRSRTIDGPTLEALAGTVIAIVPAYLTMESIFAALPHITHWVGTAMGVALGYALGALVAAYKEARFPFGQAQAPDPRHVAARRRATSAARAHDRESGSGASTTREAATRRGRGPKQP